MPICEKSNNYHTCSYARDILRKRMLSFFRHLANFLHMTRSAGPFHVRELRTRLHAPQNATHRNIPHRTISGAQIQAIGSKLQNLASEPCQFKPRIRASYFRSRNPPTFASRLIILSDLIQVNIKHQHTTPRTPLVLLTMLTIQTRNHRICISDSRLKTTFLHLPPELRNRIYQLSGCLGVLVCEQCGKSCSADLLSMGLERSCSGSARIGVPVRWPRHWVCRFSERQG